MPVTLITLKTAIMVKFVTKLISRTPKIGRRIRNVGGALLGLNATAFVLPEIPDSYIVLANILLAIVVAIWGQKQTPEDVKKEIDAEA